MKSVIALMSVLACALSADAQVTGAISHLPNGVDEVRIRNNAATGFVAFVVTVNQIPRNGSNSTAPFVVFSDPLIEPAAKPLLPGEERAVLARGVGFSEPASSRRDSKPAVRRIMEKPVVIAGIFADGGTTDDAALLARLVVRRSNMLAAVETALEILLEAGNRNIPREQLIAQYKRMVDSVRRWYLPPEQQVGRALYQSIIGKLVNLPNGPVGSPFPPSAFVEQEAAALNRRRVALLESQPTLADAFLVTAR